MRVNIRQLKSLLWVAAVGAFLLAGWTFWDILQSKKQDQYKARGIEYYHDLLVQNVDPDRQISVGPTSYKTENYEKLWLARIDGSKEEVKAPLGPDNGSDTDEEEVVELKPLSDVLQVGMIMWSSDGLLSLVAVEYMEAPAVSGVPVGSPPTADYNKSRRLHLTQGEPLMPPYDVKPYFAKVLRIDRQEVTFQWGEEEVTLTPGLDKDGVGVPLDQHVIASPEDVGKEFDSIPATSVVRDDGSIYVGQDFRTYLKGEDAQDAPAKLPVRSITPRDGGRSMLELTDVEANTYPSKFGFQTGDRIISVNGYPMGSMAEAINWAKQNSDLSTYNIVYERKGAKQYKTLHF